VKTLFIDKGGRENEKTTKLGIFSVVTFLILAPTLTQAFNSAAHIYIAEQVFPDFSRKIDLHYGSVAPDLALLMPWETAYEDTHGIDLYPYAWPWSPAQQAFAKGWWTHNWLAGADYYADDYISLKTDDLLTEELLKYLDDIGIPEDKYGLLAHYAIEKAIDLLLKDEYPELALKLLNAVLLRSWQDRFLLVKVFVWKYYRTDWLTLVETELAFRTLVGRYAVALALSSSSDVTPLAELGEQLASEMYDIDIPAEVLEEILVVAMDVCSDYKDVLDDIIGYIRDDVTSGK
jgi:HAMP domain-containing protein